MTTMTREEKMPSQYLHRKSSQILQDRKEITDFTKSYTNFEQYGKQKMRANLTHCLKISISTRLYGSVQSLSHVQLFVTPWTAARQASLSITNSQSLFKIISIESVVPSNHLILCCPLLLLPSIFSSIRVFFNDSNHGIYHTFKLFVNCLGLP